MLHFAINEWESSLISRGLDSTDVIEHWSVAAPDEG